MWWSSVSISIYMIFNKSTLNDERSWFILISIVAIGISFASLSGSSFKWFIFKPNLGKRVVHVSGEYFLEFCPTKKRYKLYKDKIFYKKVIWDCESWRFKGSNDLASSIKKELDEKYHSKISKIEQINKYYEIMNNWDGYTSVQEKRNDKISKVVW